MGNKYKLVYFDAPCRAELIRWIFAYGGQEFDDHRITREDWPTLKATTPFGKLPYLEVDGKPLPEYCHRSLCCSQNGPGGQG